MLKFTYNNKNYELKYTRSTAKDAEKAGVKLKSTVFEDLPLNVITALVTYSFKTNHPEMTEDECMDIYENIEGKDEFVANLVKDFSSTYETLMSEPDPKNAIKWESV